MLDQIVCDREAKPGVAGLRQILLDAPGPTVRTISSCVFSLYVVNFIQ